MYATPMNSFPFLSDLIQSLTKQNFSNKYTSDIENAMIDWTKWIYKTDNSTNYYFNRCLLVCLAEEHCDFFVPINPGIDSSIIGHVCEF